MRLMQCMHLTQLLLSMLISLPSTVMQLVGQRSTTALLDVEAAVHILGELSLIDLDVVLPDTDDAHV